MKVRVTFTGEYDLPDNPTERLGLFGTENIAECIKVEPWDSAIDFAEALQDFKVTDVRLVGVDATIDVETIVIRHRTADGFNRIRAIRDVRIAGLEAGRDDLSLREAIGLVDAAAAKLGDSPHITNWAEYLEQKKG